MRVGETIPAVGVEPASCGADAAPHIGMPHAAARRSRSVHQPVGETHVGFQTCRFVGCESYWGFIQPCALVWLLFLGTLGYLKRVNEMLEQGNPKVMAECRGVSWHMCSWHHLSTSGRSIAVLGAWAVASVNPVRWCRSGEDVQS